MGGPQEQSTNHLAKISEDMAVLKSDSKDMKVDIKQIYEVLNRLSVLEDNRGHTEDNIAKLFQLYGDMTKTQAAMLTRIEVLDLEVNRNSKIHSGFFTAAISVITSLCALVLYHLFYG